MIMKALAWPAAEPARRPGLVRLLLAQAGLPGASSRSARADGGRERAWQ